MDKDLVILDEPDVYLHPDLQRRLFKIVENNNNGYIIATHSVEIISEAEVESVLLVDKSDTKSTYIDSLPGIQNLIIDIGSVHNLNLTRLWNNNLLIMVEGEDIQLLNLFHKVAFPESRIDLKVIPSIDVGGWGGWQRAVGCNRLVKSSFKDINSIAIFDSDYFIDEIIKKRYTDGTKENIKVFVWSKKELENYFLNPEVIHRILLKEYDKEISNEEVKSLFESIINKYETKIQDNFAETIRSQNKAWGIQKINDKARELKREFWTDFDSKISRVPGKSVLKEIYFQVKSKYNISLNNKKVIKAFKKSDIHKDLFEVFDFIETN